mmetsp:Transcript_8613/g.19355  ORF Transcript_8613/g.19355 Transcript_8613/m.19355 type:complete len:352 (+) Transcript_8613:186-1241(+)|eukprot:CAMPEP_0172311832 /NCGR_PEP_ID=MMETSP1058-20130122/15800_1 /TAXON_ID=83371 /ORGANISM="Detonula confervacea, Strain CCMP 353" /LENGTH=351 /DNA_ID=CAMNT_0013025127 /DNA_START=177 /DNA_END=1232 /DNA_ORIENTATION=+
MPPKYQTISAEDCEDGGDADGIALQPFELEDSHSTRHDRSNSQKHVFAVIGLFVLLVVMVGYGAHKGDGKMGPSPAVSTAEVPTKLNGGSEPDVDKSMQEEKLKQSAGESLAASATPTEPRMVFSYGDSLTFGIVPHSEQPSPYAQYLELELNNLFGSVSDLSFAESESQTKPRATIVEYLGLPGWTASTMLNHMNDEKFGICSVLHRIPTLSLMIILVGTNDIGQMTNAGKGVARSIVESIVDLHKGALSCAEDESNGKFHTLAVGIPGSAFQETVHVASERSSYINEAMKEFASESSGKVSYVDFPFPYQENDRKWGEDGLHLTPEGYEALGKDLAPFVKVILEKIEPL